MMKQSPCRECKHDETQDCSVCSEWKFWFYQAWQSACDHVRQQAKETVPKSGTIYNRPRDFFRYESPNLVRQRMKKDGEA